MTCFWSKRRKTASQNSGQELFQIAEFVDYRPLGSGLNGAGYRSDAEPKEAIHIRCHFGCRIVEHQDAQNQQHKLFVQNYLQGNLEQRGLMWMAGSDSRSFTSKIICQFHTVARKRLCCKSWKWSLNQKSTAVPEFLSAACSSRFPGCQL